MLFAGAALAQQSNSNVSANAGPASAARTDLYAVYFVNTLKKVAVSSLRPADNVILQHRDGSAWDYLLLTRYDDFKDYAFQQDDPGADARTKRVGMTQDPGLALREDMASHHDTIAVRIAVQPAK